MAGSRYVSQESIVVAPQESATSSGQCVVCGQDIDDRRLAALPHSDRCIRCAEFASR